MIPSEEDESSELLSLLHRIPDWRSFMLRAEEWPSSLIDLVGTDYNVGLIEMVIELFTGKVDHPVFLVGRKGSGKTFAARRGVRAVLGKNPSLKVLTLGYRPGSPLKVAWNFEAPLPSEKLRDAFREEMDGIIVDDIHYLCEGIAGGQYAKEDFAALLRAVAERVEEGVKVLMISEDLLMGYVVKLELRGVLPALALLGQYDREAARVVAESPLELEGYERRLEEFPSRVALREVYSPDFKEWGWLLLLYGIPADESAKSFFYSVDATPRTLLKFADTFWDKIGRNETVSIVDVVKYAWEHYTVQIESLSEKYPESQTVQDALVTAQGLPAIDYDELHKLLPLFEQDGPVVLWLALNLDRVSSLCEKVADGLKLYEVPDLLRPVGGRFHYDPIYALAHYLLRTPSGERRYLHVLDEIERYWRSSSTLQDEYCEETRAVVKYLENWSYRDVLPPGSDFSWLKDVLALLPATPFHAGGLVNEEVLGRAKKVLQLYELSGGGYISSLLVDLYREQLAETSTKSLLEELLVSHGLKSPRPRYLKEVVVREEEVRADAFQRVGERIVFCTPGGFYFTMPEELQKSLEELAGKKQQDDLRHYSKILFGMRLSSQGEFQAFERSMEHRIVKGRHRRTYIPKEITDFLGLKGMERVEVIYRVILWDTANW